MRSYRIPDLAVLVVLCLLFIASWTAPAIADQGVIIHFFWGNGCPHCDKEKVLLEGLRQKYPGLEIKSYEVWYNRENARTFSRMAEAYGRKVEGVPTLFIGGSDPVVGYLSDEVTGRVIEERIKRCVESGCPDPMERVKAATAAKVEPKPEEKTATQAEPPREAGTATSRERPQERARAEKGVKDAAPQEMKADVPAHPGKADGLQPGEGQKQDQPEPRDNESGKISLPVVGELDVSKTSLPVLTLIIAGLDGFNPCAFFVLFLLLGILVYARSRRLMLLIGGIFVFFSGLVYFVFMAAWLNLFLLVGQLKIITVAAGLIALVIGVINVKDFFFFKKGVSLMIPEKAKPKLYERTRQILKKGSTISMIAATVALAIAANSYELLCTAGFPMVYTRALTLHNLPMTSYYLYLVLYNLVYVIPLACIVIAFSITLGSRKLTEREGQILKLISGLMMFCFGLVLLTRPDLLNNILVSLGLLVVSLILACLIIIVTKKRL